MATRTITGTLTHPGTSLAWSSANVLFQLLAAFATATVVYPSETTAAEALDHPEEQAGDDRTEHTAT